MKFPLSRTAKGSAARNEKENSLGYKLRVLSGPIILAGILLTHCSPPLTGFGKVIDIKESSNGCTYTLGPAVPYRPPVVTKFKDNCGKYRLGEIVEH